MVRVPLSLSGTMRISRGTSPLVSDGSVRLRKRSLSSASEAFDTSLAKEDLLVAVERVDDQVQDLGDLGLEGVGFGHGGTE
jgi:hypothetical protein